MDAAYQIYHDAYKTYQAILQQWGGNFFASDVREAWNKLNEAWDQYMLKCEENEHASV